MESITDESKDKEIIKMNELQRKMQAVATNRERHMKFIERKHEYEMSNPSLTVEQKMEKTRNHAEQRRTHQYALSRWQNAANGIQEKLFQRQKSLNNRVRA